jgi:hypothetical protein
MRIRMKETRRGSEDGFTVKDYVANQEYELAATERGVDLGRVFIREGWAEELKGKPSAQAPTPESPEPPAPRGTRKGQ